MKQNFSQLAILTAALLTAACSFSANSSKWEKFVFNGHGFQVGGADNNPGIWIRDGYTPRIEEPREASLDYGMLHPKTGAVAGGCFLQANGGKLAGYGVAKPLPNEQITLKSLIFGLSVARSDNSGFFIEELLPGEYQLFCRQAAVNIRVKQGRTTLVSLNSAE